MLEKFADPEQTKNALEIVLERFEQCVERTSTQIGGQETPDPDPLDQALPLAVYQEAIAILDQGEILTEELLQQHLHFIDTASPNDLMDRYPAGVRFCISILPFFQGRPAGELFIRPVSAQGLMRGPYGDDAYYFLNFPQEIQNQCVFSTPFYQQAFAINPDERNLLKQGFLGAWNNLKSLLAV